MKQLLTWLGFYQTTQKTVLGLIFAMFVVSIFVSNWIWGFVLLTFITVISQPANRQNWKLVKRNPLVIASALIFTVYVVGMFYTEPVKENLMYGVSTLVLSFTVLLLVVSIMLLGKDFWLKNYLFIQRGFVAMVVFTSVLCMGRALYFMAATGNARVITDAGKVGGYYLLYTELASFIMHPGFLSLFVVITLLMLINKGLHSKLSFIEKVLLVYLNVFMFMLIGRGVLFSYVLITGIYLLYYSLKHNYYKLIWALAIPTVALAAFLVFSPFSMKKRFVDIFNVSYDITEADKGKFNGLTIRLATWHCAAQVVEDNLFLGVGTGDSKQELMKSYAKNGYTVGIVQRYHTHNQGFEMMVKVGLLGLFALLGLIIVVLVRAFKEQHYLLASFALIFFLAMNTDIYLDREAGLFVFAFFVGTWFVLSPKDILGATASEKNA